MPETEPRLNSLRHPVYAGGAATIIAAVIGFIGLWVGNSGAVTNVFPGDPVTTRTLSILGPTVTAPASTVTTTITVTATGSTSTVAAGAVLLADPSSRPENVLVDSAM